MSCREMQLGLMRLCASSFSRHCEWMWAPSYWSNSSTLNTSVFFQRACLFSYWVLSLNCTTCWTRFPGLFVNLKSFSHEIAVFVTSWGVDCKNESETKERSVVWNRTTGTGLAMVSDYLPVNMPLCTTNWRLHCQRRLTWSSDTSSKAAPNDSMWTLYRCRDANLKRRTKTNQDFAVPSCHGDDR